jgi:predicted site-specific integrase-resolvase
MKEVLGIKLYTLKEVGELLGVQAQTASKYVAEGKIKARVIGGVKYVSEDGLKDFLLSTDKTRTE